MRRENALWIAAMLLLAGNAAARGGEVEDLLAKVGPGLKAWNTGGTGTNGKAPGEPAIIARDRPVMEARVEAYVALMQLGPKAKVAGLGLVEVLADAKRVSEREWVQATLGQVYLNDQEGLKRLLAAKMPGDNVFAEGDAPPSHVLADEKQLASKDADEKIEALKRMAELEVVPRRAAVKVAGLLSSPNKEVREAALRTMLKAPGDLQAKSFEAMWKIGEKAEDDPMIGGVCDSALAAELGKKLESPSEQVRLRAARLLDFGEASNRPVSPLLILAKAASADKSEEVRKTAESAWGIGLMENWAGRAALSPYDGELEIWGVMPEYVEPLKQHLSEPAIKVVFKEKAASLLLFAGELPESGLAVLEKSSLRRGTVRFVEHSKDAKVRAAFFTLLAGTSGARRELFVEDLKEPTDEQQPALAEAMVGKKDAALFAFEIVNRRKLTCEGTGALFPAVIKQLESTEKDLRKAAADAAVSAGARWEAAPQEQMEKLKGAVLTRIGAEGDDDIKRLLVESLGGLPVDKATTAALKAGAGDASPAMRAAAGRALARQISEEHLRTETWIQDAAEQMMKSSDAAEAKAGKELQSAIHPVKL